MKELLAVNLSISPLDNGGFIVASSIKTAEDVFQGSGSEMFDSVINRIARERLDSIKKNIQQHYVTDVFHIADKVRELVTQAVEVTNGK